MANLHSQKLTDLKVKHAEPGKKLTDGHGLMLWVKPSGTRSWVQRLMIQGKRRDMGLGAYPLVTLKEAREIALENRRKARRGEDPRQPKSTGIPTFESATMTYHGIHAPSWKDDGKQWLDEVKRITWPAIGHLPVHVITTAQLTAIFAPIWLANPVLANRVRQRTQSIMEWSVSQGFRPDNPAGEPLKANLPNQPKGEHHRAVPHSEVASAVKAVRQSTSGDTAKLAFEFIALTAARISEGLKAEWQEFDLDARIWTVPASRMGKTKREHRVPLSNRAIEILRSMGVKPTGFVFQSVRGNGKCLDAKTIRTMLAKAGIDATVHGFRTTFRTWCQDNGIPRDLAEPALSHTVGNAVESAYARSDVLDLRRRVMERWAEYVSA